MQAFPGKKAWITALLCALFLLCAASAQAAVSVEAELGYDGVITYLSAMPLRVRLQNDGSDANVTVAVNISRSETEYDRYEYPVFLAGGAQRNLTLPVQINYKQSAYTVEVLQGEQVLSRAFVRPRRVLSPATLLVGVLSDAPQALSYLNINNTSDQLLRGDVWQTVALTGESFPDSLEMLSAFRILAVDGVDVSALSEAQRQALDQWLRQGGIVLVGGGSTAIPAYKGFSGYTGILTGAPYQAQGVDQALLEALRGGTFAPAGQQTLRGSVMLSDLRGAAGPVASLQNRVLLDRCPVEAGVVYTAAFSLSEKPLSAWPGMTCWWQRLLLTWDQSLYQRTMNELNSYYDRYESYYVDAWLLRQLPLENEDPVPAVVLMIAAFLLLSGVGSFLVLKRLDRQELMWITVPLLSLVCAAAVMAISRGMGLNKPAAAAYAVVSVGESGAADSTVLAGVAAAETGALCLSAADGAEVIPGSDYSDGYYVDEPENTERQPQLRYLFTKGDSPSLTLPAATSWQVRTVRIDPAQRLDCPIYGSVWWEEDGLHGLVENASSLTLEPGYVLTNLGFCDIPRLLPGQQAAFSLKENPDRDGSGIFSGELVKSGYEGIYNVLEAAVYPESQEENGKRDWSDQARQTRQSLVQTCMNGWGNTAEFHYVTFSGQLQPPRLQVNGGDVTRMAYSAVIDVKLRYRAVGDTGLMRLVRGMIPAYLAELAANDVPRSSGVRLEEYPYFNLREEPVICYDLNGVAGYDSQRVRLTGGTFNCECYGGIPRLWVYNAADGRWEELRFAALPLRLKGDVLTRWMNGTGKLYLRLGPNGSAVTEADSPALTLEGRVD